MSMMYFEQTDCSALELGASKLFCKTLSDTDAMLYAGLCGDLSPLYLNESFSQQTPLATRTVHPMLVASLVGGAIRLLLPPAVETRSRQFTFLAPVFAGDTVTARVEITAIDIPTNQVTLQAQCYNQKEELVMDGTCVEVVIVPTSERK